MYETLDLKIEERVAWLTLNRPDKLNALNQATLQGLQDAIRHAVAEPAVRGIIITGAGPKAFVAGADISEFSNLDEKSGKAFAASGQAIFREIELCPKPVIAAVNGFALGGGCELAMACHMRIASEKAKFGQPEVNLGLIPGYGGTQRLTQHIGRGRATELLDDALQTSGNFVSSGPLLGLEGIQQVRPSLPIGSLVLSHTLNLLGSVQLAQSDGRFRHGF